MLLPQVFLTGYISVFPFCKQPGEIIWQTPGILKVIQTLSIRKMVPIFNRPMSFDVPTETESLSPSAVLSCFTELT